MTDDERAEIEALAQQVCPYTYRGLPCDVNAGNGHPGNRHWSRAVNGCGVNWPTEMSDQFVGQAAS